MTYEIGEVWRCKPKGRCLICNHPMSNYRMTIKVNNFRGDDIVIKVHKNCIRHMSDADILDIAQKHNVI